MARIAVVGGGIFGCASAVELARAGETVTLFERKPDLLCGATGTNLYRVHRGYHYPRDPETAIATRDAEVSFRARYGDAVIADEAHYYAIAAEGSLTSVDAFERFCADAEIGLTAAYPEMLQAETVAACYHVDEARYDPARLRVVCRHQLAEAGVTVRLGTNAGADELEGFDIRVLTSYASLNELVSAWPMQFEVCEIPVVRLPAPYAGKSLVILDGPFMSFDPLDAERHALYHVELSIHHRTVGAIPSIPARLQGVLDRGLLDVASMSTFDRMREAGQQFFIDFDPIYQGSMFSLRAVLPDTDATDARPTLIEWVDDETLVVFSGKVVTAVQAAARITELVGERATAGLAFGWTGSDT